MFSAVLDTSVLWPSTQRDFLLSLAVENLYRPLWSSAILEELRYTNLRKLLARSVPRAKAEAHSARLIEQMRLAFDDAEVTHWEPYDSGGRRPRLRRRRRGGEPRARIEGDDPHVFTAAMPA